MATAFGGRVFKSGFFVALILACQPWLAATAQTNEALEQTAARAYVWGYPLNYNLAVFDASLKGLSPIAPKISFNQLGHVRRPMGPETNFVSPNVDVLFSLAIAHLHDGPLVLEVADTDGRYTVMQFIDPWTNNFAYVGRRATGTKAGRYLIVDKNYQGDVPKGMRLIRAPASLFAIVGRIAIDNEHDFTAVNALQDGFVLRPLNPVAPVPREVAAVLPQPDLRVPKELRFWEKLRVSLAAFPPPPAEQKLLKQFAALGLLDKESPYVNADPQLVAALNAGEKAAMAQIEAAVKSSAKTVNGWGSVIHLFDYNLDYAEIGVRKDAQWQVARDAMPLLRATAARQGLWGNPGYEAAFFQVWVDADGKQLNGAHRYEWTLSKAPPAKAFWSLTMYDVPKFYLVPNPINRYGISSITPDLKRNADGSLTLYIQKDSPGPDKESNWLPAPAGDFRPALSMFEPEDAAFAPAFTLPSIRRVD